MGRGKAGPGPRGGAARPPVPVDPGTCWCVWRGSSVGPPSGWQAPSSRPGRPGPRRLQRGGNAQRWSPPGDPPADPKKRGKRKQAVPAHRRSEKRGNSRGNPAVFPRNEAAVLRVGKQTKPRIVSPTAKRWKCAKSGKVGKAAAGKKSAAKKEKQTDRTGRESGRKRPRNKFMPERKSGGKNGRGDLGLHQWRA